MLTDWTRLPDSSADTKVVRLATAGAPGRTQCLQAVVSATASGIRQVGYRLDTLGRVRTPLSVSWAIRLATGSLGASAVLGLWDGDDLQQTDGYVLDLVGISGGTELRLRRGPGPEGQILGRVAAGAYDAWQQLVLQFRYDRVGNQQVWVGSSDTGAHNVMSPVWSKLLDQYLIPRHQTRTTGRIGFVVRGGTAASTIRMGEIAVSSTLATVS